MKVSTECRLELFPAWFCLGVLVVCAIFACRYPRSADCGQTAPPPTHLQWQPCGYSGGGRYTVVAVSPADSALVLVGSDVAGVYRSTDGGETFQPQGQGLEAFAVADIAFRPDHPEQVVLLTDDGLYLSVDRGQTWTKKHAETSYRRRCCCAHLLAFSGSSLWVGSDHGVSRFDLSHDPWKPIPTPAIKDGIIHALALLDGVCFAATDRGVYQLREGGWRDSSGGLAGTPPAVTDILAHADGRLYAVEEHSGFYEWDGHQWLSRALGASLQLRYRPAAFKALAIHPEQSATVMLATHPQTWPYVVFASNDRGRSWETRESFQLDSASAHNWAAGLQAIEMIAFAPSKPDTLLLTDWWNVWRSSDGGHHWRDCRQGLQNTVVNDLEVPAGNPNKLVTAVGDNGVMVSPDGGKSWRRTMSGAAEGNAQDLEFSRQDPNKVYLLMNPWQRRSGMIYVYRSMDGGETWQDISFQVPDPKLPNLDYVNGDATNLEVDPVVDETVYVATNGYGVFRTRDGGKKWQPINRGLIAPYVKGPNALIAVTERPGILLVSTLGGGVNESLDRGEHWRSISGGYTFTFGMAAAAGPGLRLAAARPNKLIIVSDDGGRSWIETELPGQRPEHIATNAVAFHPEDQRVLVAGTLAYGYRAADGLFVSRDGGRHFARLELPENIPRVSVNAIRILGGKVPMMYVGFNGIGLFRAPLQ